MEREFIAIETKRKLQAFEALLDQTIASGAELMAHLPRARVEAGLSATYGQKIFASSSAALSHLTDARGAAVEAHRGCEALQRTLRVKMGPPDQQKPGDPILPEMQADDERSAA